MEMLNRLFQVRLNYELSVFHRREVLINWLIEEEMNERHLSSKNALEENKKLYINLINIVDLINERQRIVLDNFDVTHSQFNILRILKGAYPQPLFLKEVQQRMVFSSSDITRLVDRLMLKNLVERSTNQEDKRKINITLSAEGLKVLKKLSPEMEATVYNFFEHTISQDEATSVNLTLDKIRSLFKEPKH
jgi:DNA-binding MarR family transcriptional regulator